MKWYTVVKWDTEDETWKPVYVEGVCEYVTEEKAWTLVQALSRVFPSFRYGVKDPNGYVSTL